MMMPIYVVISLEENINRVLLMCLYLYILVGYWVNWPIDILQMLCSSRSS